MSSHVEGRSRRSQAELIDIAEAFRCVEGLQMTCPSGIGLEQAHQVVSSRNFFERPDCRAIPEPEHLLRPDFMF